MYTVSAEETWRTSITVQKLLKEEFKADEVSFYKDLVHSNRTKHEVKAHVMTWYLKNLIVTPRCDKGYLWPKRNS